MSVGFITLEKGVASGGLNLEYRGRVPPELLVKNYPEFKEFLEEVKERGWKYLYIDNNCKYVLELSFSNQPCRILPTGVWSGEGVYSVVIDIGMSLPDIKIQEVEEFRINICTKSFPRAVTINLPKKMVMYIHEPLWNWVDEWINDQEKLLQALEVYEVVRWLIREKKFNLHETLDEKRCNELLEKFEKISQERAVMENR